MVIWSDSVYRLTLKTRKEGKYVQKFFFFFFFWGSTLLGREDPLEKEMATHSSTLAWKIPWMEEPGKPQSVGLQRVRHDWATSLYFTFWNMWDLVPWPGIEPVPSCIESMESYSLERQESPSLWLLKNSCYTWETVPYLCIKSFHVCYDWILSVIAILSHLQ